MFLLIIIWNNLSTIYSENYCISLCQFCIKDIVVVPKEIKDELRKNMIKSNFVDRYDSRNKLFPWLPRTSLQNNINKIYQFKGNTQIEKRSDCVHVLVS